MQMTDLVAPFARSWQRRVTADLNTVPRPWDSPRQYGQGPNPDRVLVLGNGPAIGFGVLAQDMALPGRLADRLSTSTGRGACVDVVAERGLTIASMTGLLARARIAHYDAIVVAAGAIDALGLLPTGRWRPLLIEFVEQVRAAAAPSTEVVLLGIWPVHRSDAAVGTANRLVQARARQLDSITERLCRELQHTTFVPEADAPGASAPRDPLAYAELANRIAEPLVPLLNALAADPPADSARRLRASHDPELLRQAALERTGLLHSRSDARLQRLVESARGMFATPAAAVTLIDRDELVVKAGDGVEPGRFPREATPSNRTIRGSGMLVRSDLTGAPAFDLGWRFYAGYPLESPDGYRIGSFCVFDRVARHDLDEAAFTQLAIRIQSELWAEIERQSTLAGVA